MARHGWLAASHVPSWLTQCFMHVPTLTPTASHAAAPHALQRGADSLVTAGQGLPDGGGACQEGVQLLIRCAWLASLCMLRELCNRLPWLLCGTSCPLPGTALHSPARYASVPLTAPASSSAHHEKRPQPDRHGVRSLREPRRRGAPAPKAAAAAAGAGWARARQGARARPWRQGRQGPGSSGGGGS